MVLMSQNPPNMMFNPGVLAVAGFVVVAAIVSFGNRRQQRVMWAAVALIGLMVIYPPWLGETWQQADTEVGYIHQSVSMGYSPLWSPPERLLSNTFKPMELHWARLWKQIGAVALLTAFVLRAYRSKRRRRRLPDRIVPAPGPAPSPEGDESAPADPYESDSP